MPPTKVDRNSSETQVSYREKNKKGYVPYEHLAMGFRAVIGLVGDMIWRLAKNKFDNLKMLSGIVIIDEFDMHLHPRWQKELLITLNKTFPKVQFIISTHSPIPFLGAPEDTTIIEVNRDDNANITAKVLDINFSKLQPNAILTSPIFKFQDLVPCSKNSSELVETDDNYSDILEREQQEEKIEAYFTDERTEEILKRIKS